MARFKPIGNRPMAHYNGVIEGQINKHFDRRTTLTLDTDWNKRVYCHPKDNTMYMELGDVEQLMCENEELREELYHKQAAVQEAAIQRLYEITEQSTSQVVKCVQMISAESNGAFTTKGCFRFCYQILKDRYFIDFKQCPQGESKLHWLWKIGYLPVVVMIMHSLLELTRLMYNNCPSEFDMLAKAMESKRKPAKVKSKGTTSPF